MEGHWVQCEAFTNMDAVLDVVGMTDPQMRAMILQIKPEIVLAPSGDAWNYKMVTPHSTREVTFTHGQEIDYVSIIGKPVKSKMLIEGNQLREIHDDPDDPAKTTTITRNFEGDVMTVTLTVKDVVSVGKYKRN